MKGQDPQHSLSSFNKPLVQVPNNRGSPAKQQNSRRPIGCSGTNPNMPPRYGVSTQQHGTVTKDSLNALKSRQWL